MRDTLPPAQKLGYGSRNTKGPLVRKRISQRKGFLSTYYTYNSEGQVIKEEVYRDIDTMNSILKPAIERSLLWNTETMEYQLYEGQYKKKVFNSYGNQYLEVTRYMDSLGYLAREAPVRQREHTRVP